MDKSPVKVMVAKAGKGWILAPSLVALVDEVDGVAPGRNRASDGSIGDTAHFTRKSDHNPSGGYVTAVDLTHNPSGGFDAHAFAEHLRQRQDPRVKYVISAGRTYNSISWEWRPYTGSNRHDHHVHVSVRFTDVGLKGMTSWLGSMPSTPQTEQHESGTVEVQLDVLRRGSKGGQVRSLQLLLNGKAQQGITIDGDFGPRTEVAVHHVQRFFQIAVDGVVGRRTWGCLFL